MNKRILLFIISILSISGFSQEIELIDGVYYLDGAKYVKVEKINKKKFFIRNVNSNQKILEIKLHKAYSSLDKKTHILPRVFFIRIKGNMTFERDILSELELVRFLYKDEIVLKYGVLNEKKYFDYLDYLKNL